MDHIFIFSFILEKTKHTLKNLFNCDFKTVLYIKMYYKF